MRTAHASTWAILTALIEDKLARVIVGEPVDLTEVATLINARRREGEAIGEPEPRDITDTVESIAADLAAEREISS
jgi:hypothetical protein